MAKKSQEGLEAMHAQDSQLEAMQQMMRDAMEVAAGGGYKT